MTRPLRIEIPGAFYHVMARGNARQDIFIDHVDRVAFLHFLSLEVSRCAWRCHAYCLMKNHYHLLIEISLPNLSKGMRNLNGSYAQAFNFRHDRVGHLLQGRFRSPLVEKEQYLLELSRYLVLNPVRSGFVEHPGQWSWSSYKATAGKCRVPEFLDTDLILSQFAMDRNLAQAAYQSFVDEALKHLEPLPRIGSLAVGNGPVSEGVAETIRGKRNDESYPRVDRRADRPSLIDLFEASLQGVDRNTRIVEAYVEHGYRMAEIAGYLGISHSTISRAVGAASEKRRAGDDPQDPGHCEAVNTLETRILPPDA